MGTKSDSPKLTPAERLARKRAAARLRQQRCRARKRQAMLEKKRGETDRQGSATNNINTQHSPRSPVVMQCVRRRPQPRFPTYKPVRSTESSVEAWTGVRAEIPHRPQIHRFPSEPIYHCVSFDSQKSLEEAQHIKSLATSTPPESPLEKTKIVVTPSRTPPPLNALVQVLSDQKREDKPLVSEEEAAVAAMLSLKSGARSPTEKPADENKKRPISPPREVTISHESKKSTHAGINGNNSEEQSHGPRARLPLPRRLTTGHFEAYHYGPPMKIPPLPPHIIHGPPGYYRVPVPPPHAHYRRGYYPPAPRYVSYEYK